MCNSLLKIVIFFLKNLVISKKCCTFAHIFEFVTTIYLFHYEDHKRIFDALFDTLLRC